MIDVWCIGIDMKNDMELIVIGFFFMLRNLIFLGIILVDIGLFLVVFNVFILLISVLFIVVI